MNTQSITKIRKSRDCIQHSLKSFRTSRFPDKYGDEQEYTAQGIRTGIESILIDVKSLARAPAKFIQKSTCEERNHISACLESMNTHMKNEDLPGLACSIDEIKPVLRNIGIRHTNERMEVFDEQINEIQRKSSELSQHMEDQESRLSDMHANEKNRSDEIEQILVTVKNRKEIIEGFVQNIQNRESQLENQESATKQYKEKLEEFKRDHEIYLLEAKELIESAKLALEYKTAEGLSTAFTERYNESNNIKSKIFWIILAIVFFVSAVSMGYVLTTDDNLGWEVLIGRLSLIPILIAGAWFCAGQYVKQRNIAEDYAYKASLAKSIVGFSDQLSTENSKGGEYSYFMERVLTQITNAPLRIHTPKKPIRLRPSRHDSDNEL